MCTFSESISFQFERDFGWLTKKGIVPPNDLLSHAADFCSLSVLSVRHLPPPGVFCFLNPPPAYGTVRIHCSLETSVDVNTQQWLTLLPRSEGVDQGRVSEPVVFTSQGFLCDLWTRSESSQDCGVHQLTAHFILISCLSTADRELCLRQSPVCGR